MIEWHGLSALDDHIWARLQDAVAHASDPWRLAALATVSQDGPAVRMLALRRAIRETGEVELHTDIRTPKVAQLRADPRAQLLFWDSDRQEQLRLGVTMSVHAGDAETWGRVPDGSRGNYGTDPAPGTPIDHADAFSRTPSVDRFAVLRGRIITIDAVALGFDPHRRARWQAGDWSWVAP